MPRVCTICSHPERAAIDAALVSGEPMRGIARMFAVSEDALNRHKRDGHTVTALAKAAGAETVAADDLLAQVRFLQVKALGVLATAEAAGSLNVALSAVREARSCVELLAKLLGELDDRPQVNVLVSPEWAAVRTALLDALRPYPDARTAVSTRLLAIGDGR